MAEQGKPGSAVHLAHDPFGSRVDSLGAAVVEREGEPGVDGGPVEFQAVAEGMQVRQVDGANWRDPVGELGVVALCRRQQLRELADQASEFGYLRACRGEFPQTAFEICRVPLLRCSLSSP